MAKQTEYGTLLSVSFFAFEDALLASGVVCFRVFRFVRPASTRAMIFESHTQFQVSVPKARLFHIAFSQAECSRSPRGHPESGIGALVGLLSTALLSLL